MTERQTADDDGYTKCAFDGKLVSLNGNPGCAQVLPASFFSCDWISARAPRNESSNASDAVDEGRLPPRMM